MASEKRLIDANQFRGKHEVAEVNGKLCSVILYADIVNAPAVDAVEVNRLGKLGRLMMPYKGDPRGNMGPRGCSGEDFRAIELDPITDVDGNRWIPVLEQDLCAMKVRADDTVKVVRCKDCEHSRPTAWYTAKLRCTHPSCMRSQVPHEVPPDHFCGFGERKDNGNLH